MSLKPSSSRYRSKGKIFADILSAVDQNEGAKPTHILYKANLSHDRLTKYLSLLEESDLLTKSDNPDKTEYFITEKGRKFLVEFRRMEQFAEAFGLEI